MKLIPQTDSYKILEELVERGCNDIRFGPEFCEWKIPDLEALKKVYRLADEKGVRVTYITPLVSNRGLERIRSHLEFLDGEGEIKVVVNDIGVLNILERHNNLKPHLGRLRVFIPGRCPWPQITPGPDIGFFEKRRMEKIFYQTSLNYEPTVRFFQSHGIKGIDVDWIPNCFPNFDYLIKKGLSLSVHAYLVPITVSKRCHTARFCGEGKLDRCSKPCDTKAFQLIQKKLKAEFYLNGNAVYRLIRPTKKDVRTLEKKADEIIIPVNPVLKIKNRYNLDPEIRLFSGFWFDS